MLLQHETTKVVVTTGPLNMQNSTTTNSLQADNKWCQSTLFLSQFERPFPSEPGLAGVGVY